MTQYQQATPTRDSHIYHASDGCDIRHQTNETLDRCEGKESKLDDLGRDYVAAGITNEEDIFPCLHCGASVMPWYLQCEGCGKNPSQPHPSQPWTCNLCGYSDHENEQDADECCRMSQAEYDTRHKEIGEEHQVRYENALRFKMGDAQEEAVNQADLWLERAVDRLDRQFMGF